MNMRESNDHATPEGTETPWTFIGLIVEGVSGGKKGKNKTRSEPEHKEQMALVITPEGPREVPLSEATAKSDPTCFTPDSVMLHGLERMVLEYIEEKRAAIEKTPSEEERTPTALDITDRQAFRQWLEENHATAQECWISVKRGRPANDGAFYYLDAVEEALCFGWIDSTQKNVEGACLQRFSPRKPNSNWTELNKERVRRLEKLGLMTDAGRKVLPPMGPRSFRIDPDIEKALKQVRCWKKFKSFPPLYQRVRASNVAFYKTRDPEAYDRALSNLLSHTIRGELYGEWNDYGRLLDY